jgi:uncharacterized damage-inducible protein DinB
MATETVTKERLLDGLRQSGADTLAKLSAIPAEKFEDGAYESGWNARQILAHIAAIEWTYPRLLDVAREGDKPREEKNADAKPPQRTASGGIDNYNQRSIERYAEASVAELLEVFKKNRETTIAAIEAADDDLLLKHVKSAGGIPGPLGTVLNYVAVMHVNGHVNDIVAAAG